MERDPAGQDRLVALQAFAALGVRVESGVGGVDVLALLGRVIRGELSEADAAVLAPEDAV